MNIDCRVATCFKTVKRVVPVQGPTPCRAYIKWDVLMSSVLLIHTMLLVRSDLNVLTDCHSSADLMERPEVSHLRVHAEYFVNDLLLGPLLLMSESCL